MAAGRNIDPNVADKLAEEGIASTQNMIIFDKDHMDIISSQPARNNENRNSYIGINYAQVLPSQRLPCISMVWRSAMRLQWRQTFPWRKQER